MALGGTSEEAVYLHESVIRGHHVSLLVLVVKNFFELWKLAFAGELYSLGTFTALLDFGLVRNPAPDRFSVQGEML